MAKIGTIAKQPREELAFSVDYSEALKGVVPDGVSVSATVSPPGAVAVGPFSCSGPVVQAVVSGGLDGVVYIITMLATVVTGHVTQVFEDEIKVKVKEIV